MSTIDEQVREITAEARRAGDVRSLSVAVEANQRYLEFLDELLDGDLSIEPFPSLDAIADHIQQVTK